jgi:four helix bundle protein
MTNAVFNETFRSRTKAFAVAVIKLSDQMPIGKSNAVMVYQLCKSATSVGANFRAFCRGRSKNEKYAKICIVVEEADETLYWLEIILESRGEFSNSLKPLIQEGTEILKIVAKIKSALAP